MSMTKFFGLIAVSATLCGGCSEATTPETANLQQKGGVWTPNGPDLVSARIFGDVIQGIRVLRDRPMYVVGKDGSNLYTIDETTYEGNPVGSLWAPVPGDGFFHVNYLKSGMAMTAERFDVASLTFSFSSLGPDGKSKVTNRIFIKEVSPSSAPNHGLHWAFHSYIDSDGRESEPVSVCLDHDGKPEPMVPLRGVNWNLADGRSIVDETAVHFACASAAPGACTTWGYDLWSQKIECPNPKFPASCHVANNVRVITACTRAKRDDLCGTGTAHTLPGKLIMTSDNMGISGITVQEAKDLETLVSDTGASCVNPENFRHKELQEQDGACYAKLTDPTMMPPCTFERPRYDIIGVSVLVE
jgi:hypothetical protein